MIIIPRRIPQFLQGVGIAFLAFVLSSCSSRFALADLTTTLNSFGITELPSQKDYPDADAVILLDRTDNQVMMERSGLVTLESHHVIKKLFRNVGEEATVNVYVGEDEELTGILARTIRPDGSIVDVQPSDFYTLTGIAGQSVIFANVKTIRFTFPAADKDCIVEYQFRKKNRRPFVNDIWYIQNSLPTIRNHYTLSMPGVMSLLVPYQYKTYPTSVDMKPMVIINNRQYSDFFSDPISFTWSRGDIPAFKPEEMMPPPATLRTQIRFALASWKGWSGIAEWYYQTFFKSQLVESDTVTALAKRLTEGRSTDEEKIRAVYDYVRSIRYVAVQMGESGLRPSKPHEILANNYGDCKDKSILTVALLKAAGITAYPVLALTADAGLFDPDFVSWNFNHMIVKAAAKEKTYWMDPTSEFSPFNTLPWQVQNIPVLTLLSEKSGVIESTPLTLGKYNETEIGLYEEIAENGDASVHAVIKTRGEEARYHRAVMAEKSYSEIKEFCLRMLINDAARAVIDTVVLKHQHDLDSAFVLDISFSVRNALQQQGGIALFDVNVFKMVDDLRWTAKESRKFPMWFPYGTMVNKKTVIRFNDSSLVVRPLPGFVTVQNGYLFYDGMFEEKSKNTVVIQEKLHMNSMMIPPGEYRKMKTFYERMKTASEKPIVLTKR